MFPKTDLTSTKAWGALAAHAEEMKKTQMRQLFADDAKRFDKYHLQLENILFDYSKNIITDKTLTLLQSLAKECQCRKLLQRCSGPKRSMPPKAAPYYIPRCATSPANRCCSMGRT
ncbi:hypothetical protein MKQ70_08615 [Chitinophaga sedimenti]|uniref:hypothetical protein n=1 Tax=Chitinophaga sedimenti TaxID=2033606 RepID=UPI002006D681|nr:hypothetical protein [Chitinophaga sedimenti]MCK7555068.1 hypothetical protein [Chitinophaga sedimenti]